MKFYTGIFVFLGILFIALFLECKIRVICLNIIEQNFKYIFIVITNVDKKLC